ncbi:MAG: peptide transporter, periplasmic peptide-binding lipoprotein, partial [Chloroflexi bacterium]|nr:peptide transporter, periplasmic peptide-binding lipoprotein [Chloroflexota bacterium]
MGAPRHQIGWRAQPLALFVVVCAVLTGCASGSPAPRASDQQAGGGQERSGPTKTLNVAQSAPIRAYGPWDFASTAGGVAALAEIHTTGLVSYDRNGKREGRVAARIPSIDDGTVTMLTDGRMRTVWALRPDVRWHDGKPLTADDLAFSFRMTIDPAMVSPIAPIIVQADTVEALDPLTVAITYKTPVFAGLELTNRAFWLFPKHVLGEAFEADKEAFLALPFFTTEYVNLGPFRLVDFGLGEQQVFEAFDAYFLGRPKTQRIIIHTIADANAMVAGMKAGSLDVLSEKVLSPEQAVLLRDEWAVSGEGRLLSRQDNWAYISPQFDLQWARPVELSRDPRVRAALLHAIDRDAIGEFVQPGFADTSGDTFMRSNDPRAAFVGQP